MRRFDQFYHLICSETDGLLIVYQQLVEVIMLLTSIQQELGRGGELQRHQHPGWEEGKDLRVYLPLLASTFTLSLITRFGRENVIRRKRNNCLLTKIIEAHFIEVMNLILCVLY